MAFRAVGTAASGNGAVSPGAPAGVVAGDILVMLVEMARADTISGTGTPPTGWTIVTGFPTTPPTSPGPKFYVLWRRADGSGSDTPTLADAGDHQVAQIAAYSGRRAVGDPWNVISVTTEDTSDTSGSTGTLTTTVDGCDVLGAGMTDNDGTSTTEFSGWTNASLVSITERMDVSTVSGSGGGFGLADGVQTTAGAVNATTMTYAHASRKVLFAGALAPENAPVALLNDSDGTQFATGTPTIGIGAIDLDGDDVTFQIQIGNDNNFNASTTIDSYSESNVDAYHLQNSSGTAGDAQKITGDGRTLTSAQFYLKKTGSPTGNITAKVYASSGGGAPIPTGAALATSDNVAIAGVGTSPALFEFTFSTPATLTSGTQYFVTVEYPSGDASNYLQVGYDSSAPTHAGIYAEFFGVWSSTGAKDLAFYAFHSPASTIYIDKLSASDPGFAPLSGGDTDPFTQGTNVTYTVQAADVLAYGTYYERLRAKDPAGGNVFGAWTTFAQTFLIVDGRPKIIVLSGAVHRAAGW